MKTKRFVVEMVHHDFESREIWAANKLEAIAKVESGEGKTLEAFCEGTDYLAFEEEATH